jgi:hypothetical protein
MSYQKRFDNRAIRIFSKIFDFDFEKVLYKSKSGDAWIILLSLDEGIIINFAIFKMFGNHPSFLGLVLPDSPF